MPSIPVELAAGLDARAIAPVYARAGRVHIAQILTKASADETFRCLASEIPWRLNTNEGDRAVSLAAGAFEQLPEPERAKLIEAVHARAARSFQYLFYSFPASDFHEEGKAELKPLYVMRVHEFLNSAPFLEFARAVTGVRSIDYVDSQATLYKPGHFLTLHDDDVHEKKRIAAYVLNLTPRWSPDWGGILQFIDRDGHIAEGYTPTFNALNLFRVPQLHSVSCVAPFAQVGRYSITGWLRER
jgi:Rps23 Pro-64 3,4-dihydroxylase Tpa1-like proline 4-hydroxylase